MSSQKISPIDIVPKLLFSKSIHLTISFFSTNKDKAKFIVFYSFLPKLDFACPRPWMVTEAFLPYIRARENHPAVSTQNTQCLTVFYLAPQLMDL